MKRKLKIFMLLFCLCMLSLPQINVKAAETKTKITMVAGEVRQLSGVYWYSKFYSSDDRIVSVDTNGNMTANKVGKAVVSQYTLTGIVEYDIKVVGEVDIVVAMGQSNMCGSGGDASKAPVALDGAVQYYNKAVRPLQKQGTLLPSFANQYYKKTKMPVVIIQTAVGGSSSQEWIQGGLLNKAASDVKKCKQYLKKYKVKVRNIYMLWFQGETDAKIGVAKSAYMNNMRKIFKKMKKVGTKKCMVIQVGQYLNRKYPTDLIISAQKTLCKKDKNFEMVSTVTASLSGKAKWYSDNVHFNQAALNKIGLQAGKKAAKIAKKAKK